MPLAPVGPARSIKSVAVNLHKQQQGMKRLRFPCLFFVLVFVVFSGLSPLWAAGNGSAPAEKTMGKGKAVENDAAPEPTPVFVDIYRHVNAIPKRLIDLKDTPGIDIGFPR